MFPFPRRRTQVSKLFLENSTLTERGLLPPFQADGVDLGQVDQQSEDVHVVVDLPYTRLGTKGPLEF